jgi:hypothetical protein
VKLMSAPKWDDALLTNWRRRWATPPFAGWAGGMQSFEDGDEAFPRGSALATCAGMFHVKHREPPGGGQRWRKWFHVKHRDSGLENAILQNNPMH